MALQEKQRGRAVRASFHTCRGLAPQGSPKRDPFKSLPSERSGKASLVHDRLPVASLALAAKPTEATSAVMVSSPMAGLRALRLLLNDPTFLERFREVLARQALLREVRLRDASAALNKGGQGPAPAASRARRRAVPRPVREVAELLGDLGQIEQESSPRRVTPRRHLSHAWFEWVKAGAPSAREEFPEETAE